MNRILQKIGQPMAFGRFTNFWKVSDLNGIERQFWMKAAFAGALSSVTAPLRVLERLIHQKHIETTQIVSPPIFIIGHWRSGTTYLHQLMSQDDRFGYVTLYQTLAPEIFFIGPWTIKTLVGIMAPNKRPGDNVRLFLDGPQEEEFALANLSPHAFYHHWSFPQQFRWYFKHYALFEDTPGEDIEAFKRIYRFVLLQATRNMHGKQLIIKNPTNTGRIPILLQMFPNAKFIHIYRNPFAVFRSSFKFYREIHTISQLQSITNEQVRNNILYSYEAILNKLFEDIPKIPDGNFAEVRFEELEASPVEQMQRLYTELNLGNFEEVQPKIQAFVDSTANYRKNNFKYDTEMNALVEKHWQFALERWGYQAPT